MNALTSGCNSLEVIQFLFPLSDSLLVMPVYHTVAFNLFELQFEYRGSKSDIVKLLSMKTRY